MSHYCKVKPYSISTLKEIFAETSGAKLNSLENKFHLRYLEDYFRELVAQTIVAELEYVDQDFLEDFSGYYVKCFQNYKRKCTRVHFFNIAFEPEDLKSLLSSPTSSLTEEGFRKAYLGFIVVKPLPKTFIGRTCLVTYPTEETNRRFPVVRQYFANLFGIPLQLDSLAFQEQDNVVAACATSALWSAFHATGEVFQHPVPSPVDITRVAAEVISDSAPRALPNVGLSVAQVLHGIREVGLESILVNARDDFLLKDSVSAYLKCSIPALLLVKLWDLTTSEPKYLGYHAVTVVGFNESSEIDPLIPADKPRFRSSRIDKIYVHDDQIGPFARMKFDGNKVLEDDSANGPNSLSTSWPGEDNKIGKVRAVPDILIIPVYHKIRIPLHIIRTTLHSLDGIIEALKAEGFLSFSDRVEWNIHLTTVNQLKTELRQDNELPSDEIQEFLMKSMPRFIWRASGSCSGRRLMELFFDATDIEQGEMFLSALQIDSEISVVLSEISKMPDIEKIVREYVVEPEYYNPFLRIFDWFAKNPPS